MVQTRVSRLGLIAAAFLVLSVSGLRGAEQKELEAKANASDANAKPTGTSVPKSNSVESPRVRNSSRPNIILVVADDLGYGDLGCYGQTRIKTPNLDKMAEEGMRFTQAYSGSTVCAPSRCVLMTGLHTGHARIRGNAALPLSAKDVTIPEVLKDAGYKTGLVGKWGLGNENTTGVPWKKGFNEFIGYLDQVHAHDYYPVNLWRYDPANNYEGHVSFPENADGNKGIYSHDVFTTAALNFCRINQPGYLNRYRPFFLYLAYTIPHANNEQGKRTGNGMEVPSTAPYSDEAWPAPEKGKAAMITRMDTDIGRLMGALKRLNMESNTVVFFTSDNGPHKEGGVDPKFFNSSGKLRGYKRDLYEGGIRVPMIARWPGTIRSGQVSSEPLAFWDFMSTAADLAGVTNAPTGDGISFLPTLLGKTQTNRHEFFYWEFHERGFQRAMRMGNWKGISTLGKDFELYDLQSDPSEEKNVAEEHTDVVQKILDRMKAERTPSEKWPEPTNSAAKPK